MEAMFNIEEIRSPSHAIAVKQTSTMAVVSSSNSPATHARSGS